MRMNEARGKVLGSASVFCRTKRMVCGFAFMVLAGAAHLTGCDPSRRHEILTFFLDGMPPLERGGEVMFNDPNDVEDGGRPAGAMPAGSRHKPGGQCSRCHAEQSRTVRPILVEPVPQLCYGCHTNYAAAQTHVHGPVAVGACLFCHEAHRSRQVNLLKLPQPGICYQCHSQELVEKMSAHQESPVANCTRCHDPHVAARRMLLKSY